MRRNITNDNAGAKKILVRLAEEKKKSIMALCLIAVMAFMWIKVFVKKTPQGAEAAPATEQSNAENPLNEEHKVSFVELPKVAGRNDVIVRDFFASDGWQHFIGRQGRKPNGSERVNVVLTDGNDEVIRNVAKKLKLEATMVSTNPIAFINGQVRRIGDKMLVTDGTDRHVCEVVEIEDNTVVIKIGEAEITLKLMPVSAHGT